MSLEDELSRFESELAEAEKASDALRAALKRLRKAARVGDVAALEKLFRSRAKGRSARERADGLLASWSFDARAHMRSGYATELREAAAAAGLNMLERDGKLYAFPLLLSLQPQGGAIKIGRKKDRSIRPSELVRKLIAIQKKPQRLGDAHFLDLLYKAYQRVAGPDWSKLASGPGPAVPLADIHALLTLLPGSDYAIEEFGRDLFLLDRKPDTRTKDGSSFKFLGSTLSKERVQRLAVFDEDGREHVYIGLRFIKGQ